jgi:D-alanyl-D-alanine carboxypeptidase
MDRDGAASVAIRINGELRPVDAPIPADAVFPIYSITKTLTAICALRLVERGAFQLSDPIRRLLPDIDLPESITLAHLLRHTSGLRDYGGLPEYHGAVRSHPATPWTRQQFLEAVLPGGLLFAPGDSWSYSNAGYMLIVDAIERVTNQTFARVLDETIVAPLALQRTCTLEQLEDLQRCVPGYSSEVSIDRTVRDVRGVYHPGWCAPRLVASTAEEVSRIFDALIQGELLASRTLEAMFTLVPLPPASGAPSSIGAGLGVYSDSASSRGLNYHHGGGGPGYSLSATIYPSTANGRVAVAVFLNSSEGTDARETEQQWLAMAVL